MNHVQEGFACWALDPASRGVSKGAIQTLIPDSPLETNRRPANNTNVAVGNAARSVDVTENSDVLGIQV